MTEATTSSYWISPTALYITLNANGDPNYIVGNTAAGAQILCYMRDINGLDYDAGHNYRRWPLLCSPTFFNTSTAKYVYAAIPRPNAPFEDAYIVFPNERLDIYGKNESETQIGSTDYYYIFLQGIISATNAGGTQMREWTHQVETGTLSSDEAIDAGGDQTWWRYLSVSDTVEFLKRITMSPASKFLNLVADLFTLNGKSLTEVADENTPVDSETAVVTPHYIGHHFLSKTEDDIAQGRIGFLQGLWVKALGLFGIDADGNAKLNNIEAGGDVSVGGNLGVSGWIRGLLGYFSSVQSDNYTGDGITDTGYRLTSNHNGHSKLTVDELYVRMKAIFESLEIKKELVTGGNQVLSCAASTISFVDYLAQNGETGQYLPLGYSQKRMPFTLRNMVMMLTKRNISGIFSHLRTVRSTLTETERAATSRVRCYFLAEDGERKIENWWQVGDLARCQTFNLAADSVSDRDKYWGGGNVTGNIFWWRKVVNVSSSPVSIDGKLYHYFDVSVSSCAPDSVMPAAGDEVSQWGNDRNTERMNLIVTEVNGQDAAVKMYEGINQFSMSVGAYGNPLKIQLAPKSGCRVEASKWELMTSNFVSPIAIVREEWTNGTIAQYYEVWQHKGSSWLCVASTNEAFRVTESFVNQGVSYSKGAVLSQRAYDDLDFENKLKCARVAFGTTTDEPSLTSPNWRVYAQKGKDADVWTIGSDGYWYKNGTKYTDTAHPNGIKAEGEDGTGVQLKGSVNVLYHSATETSLEDLTGVQVGDCYVVDANRHIYFYNGSSAAFPANWNDLGEFRGQKGDPGDDSYMHIAYADNVTFDSQGNPTSCAGFTTVKQKEAYDWIGLCTNNTATDPTDYRVYAWNYVKGADGKDAPDLKTNILLRTYFEKGIEFVKEKWSAAWSWVAIDTNPTTQFIEGHQSVRVTVPAGIGNDTTFMQNVLGKLKPDTWYTFSFYTYASQSFLFCIHNIKSGTYKKIYADDTVYVDGEVRTGLNDHNDVEILAPGGGTLNGERHYITFKTKSSSEIASDLNSDSLAIGWYFYNNSASEARYFVLCMPKLEEGRNVSAYMPNEDDLKGEDAWRIAANPANVIITQGMDNNVGTFTTAEVTFSASKGNVNADIVTLSNITWEHFAGTVDNTNKKVIVTSPMSSGGVYYTEGWFSVTVEVRDPNTNAVLPFPVKILCYANLLGTWKTKVIGDTETSVAQKLTYGYDPAHQGEPIALQNFGTYIRSSEVNISEIKATRSKEDLFNFGLNNWTINDAEYSDADFDKDYPRYWDKSESYNDIYSPVVSLKPGVYCFSAYVRGDFDTSSNSIALQQGCSVEIPGDGTTISASDIGVVTGDTIKVDGTTYQRKYAIFEIAGSEALCSVNLWGNTYGDVVRPKLEKGSAPTPWQTTVSQIKQTATEIDLSVRDDLSETGINISGETKTIRLSAEHTTIDGDLSVPRVISEGNGTYTKMEVGQFELGIVDTKVIDGVQTKIQIPAFQLELDNDGNAILRYMNKDGQTVGLIDESFFSQQAVGDSWVQITVIPIRDLAGGDDYPSYDDIEQTLQLGGATAIYYQYNEGYVLSGTTKRYNISGTSTPSAYNGKWFTSKFNVVNRTPTPTPTPMPISPYSAFINPNALPYRRLIDMNHYQDVYVYYQALRQLNMTTVLKMEAAGDIHYMT